MPSFADELSVKVSAQDAGVKAAITTIRGEIRSMEKELVKANAEWMKTGQGTEQIQRTEKRIKELREELNKLTPAQKKVQRGAKDTGNAFQRMGMQINKSLGALNNPLLLAGGGIALAMFAKKTIAAASDVVESMNKTKVIFGEASAEVIAFAQTSADQFGQSQSAALGAAANFAALGKAAGLSGKELSDYAITLSGLASDMASFNNTSPEEAVVALSSAMRGEYESIRRYNVLLDANTLSQVALDKGLTKTYQKTLPQNIKVLAAYQAVLDQTKDQQGDFARTQDDYANLSRRVAAEWQNLQAAIGESFLPAAKQGLMVLKELFNVIKGIDPNVRGLVITFVALAAALVFLAPKLVAVKALILENAAAMKVAEAGGGRFRQILAGLSSMVNPFTIALAAITAGVIAYAQASANAKAAADELLATMDAVTGANTEATYDAIAVALGKDVQGMEDWQYVLEATGLTQADMTKALAEGGDEMERVRKILNDARPAVGYLTAEARAVTGAANAYENQAEVMWDAQQAHKAAKEAEEAAAAATGRNAGKISVTALKTAWLAAEQERAAASAERLTRAEKQLAKGIAAADRIFARRDAMRAYRKAQDDFIKKPSLQAGEAMDQAMLAVANTFDNPKKKAQFLKREIKNIGTTVEGSNLPANIRNKITNPLKAADVEARKLLSTIKQIAQTQMSTPNWGKIATLPFASGGPVIGPGTATSDSIPARLSNGEFVIRANAAKVIGYENLNRLNIADRLPPNVIAPSIHMPVKAPRQPAVAAAASGPTIGEIHINNPAAGIDIETAVLSALRRAERIKRERG